MGLEWRGGFPGGGDLRAWREGRGGSWTLLGGAGGFFAVWWRVCGCCHFVLSTAREA